MHKIILSILASNNDYKKAFIMLIKKLLQKLTKDNHSAQPDKTQAAQSKEGYSFKTWSNDRYGSILVQRNLLLLITVILLLVMFVSIMTIRYLRSTKSVEPFIIEIEKKTGVPTVVEPVSIQMYSADEAVRRSLIWQYITAREEYNNSTYSFNFMNTVRVLSSPDVYYGDYRPKFGIANPKSPYNLYGNASSIKVSLKSMIFPTKNSVQVRLLREVMGNIGMKSDKIVFMEFEFKNIEMNNMERMINPLGFQVTLYRIEDERS
ncbi:VirB8 family type IV secretion system protein [Candidatus Cyrtobacter comes]|uniref:virB8 family protein n=1 Tax=Candidatus Cyrtobacter comes TaxID=675776 RepID=UPI002ACED7B6|nr:type IV secretion system protein [Candidatus Cyrtobacter comes]